MQDEPGRLRAMNRAGWLLAGVALFLLSGCATSRIQPGAAFIAPLSHDPSRGAYVARMPFHTDDDPGRASLGMILEFWRDAYPGDYGGSLWDRRRLHGVELDGRLEAYLADRDLWSHFREGRLDDVRERVRAGAPVMIFFQEKPLDRKTLMAGVVVAYDEEGERLLIYTGGSEPLVLSYAEFLAQWRRAYHRMLMICPPDAPAWSLTAEELASRGRFHIARDRPASALSDFERALASDPADSMLYVDVADAHRLLDRPDESAAFYRAALAIDDLNARAANNLAYVLAEDARDLDEALALAERATTLEPLNPVMLDTLGLVRYQRGEYEQAARALERALDRSDVLPGPLRAEIGLRLVWTYHRLGAEHLARQTLDAALQYDTSLVVPPALRGYMRHYHPVYRR